ncbi:ISKra4 family transposase [Arthrobacter livingstonensis]|uniref:ISKra4 family transposase n=1 Tax=Arthrobacter livingstonensis TaxID=670078 RepID=A0A2V5LDM6_9MICC|nr:ISKra4 family transposase [Arthrobacter livingstonensis]PYI69719.1 ISKra4 family transposase [Arthrobacter livingstonensis]
MGGVTGGGLPVLEEAIRAGMTALGASLLEGLLAADSGHRGPRIECGSGHLAEFVSYRTKDIDTVLGTVQVQRAYYHCRKCRAGVVPRDAELGVCGSSISGGLASMIATAGAAVPFAQAAGLIKDLAGIALGTKRVERAAEAVGAAATASLKADTEAVLAGRVVPLPPPAPPPEILYLAVDGTGVPMTLAETEGRAGKGPDGRARTREAKLGCLFTQTGLDDEGRPVRDEDSTSYFATLEPVEKFSDLVAAEAKRRGYEHIRQFVFLGDGAHWIWNMATARLPEATQIVDLFHAREHLHELANLLAFIITEDPNDWYQARRTELDSGDIDAITNAAMIYPLVGSKAKERTKALAYFQRNAHRMQYARFRRLGMFVGSGTVEAGCKAVIGQRLKLSGMRWSDPGATSIITLRCQHASTHRNQTTAA